MAQSLARVQIQEIVRAVPSFERNRVGLLFNIAPEFIPVIHAHAGVMEAQRVVLRQCRAVDIFQPEIGWINSYWKSPTHMKASLM